jgi:hypothetical protein
MDVDRERDYEPVRVTIRLAAVKIEHVDEKENYVVLSMDGSKMTQEELNMLHDMFPTQYHEALHLLDVEQVVARIKKYD